MKALLELEQYTVAVATDGEVALRLLRGGLRPGLILLDLRLPGKDAFAFRVEQLQEPLLCRIPVVVYSGATDVEERAKSLGAVAWFHKPVEVDTLLDLVARYCS
jgi:CheY-like chemotaxis protein